MHSGTLKKWALALTFWMALHTAALKAQIFTAPLQASTTGTNPVDFEFRADGTLIAKDNSGLGSLLTADQGAGTRMLWFPGKSAFRAGTVIATEWDFSNIGYYSLAMGFGTTASGAGSAALGAYTTASGEDSLASGNYNTASGYGATAFGGCNLASGKYSTTSGTYNSASGAYSSAAGTCTTSSAYASFSIGNFNLDISATGAAPSANSWVPTDPLFEVGNGGDGTYGNPALHVRADAFVVYKNGNAVVQGNLNAGGTITAAPGGDIPMYTGH